jgi:hypothetical protein
MDAPHCPICETKHWPRERHSFKKDVANAVANVGKPVANKKSRYKDQEARKKYMRELMRKRRIEARRRKP